MIPTYTNWLRMHVTSIIAAFNASFRSSPARPWNQRRNTNIERAHVPHNWWHRSSYTVHIKFFFAWSTAHFVIVTLTILLVPHQANNLHSYTYMYTLQNFKSRRVNWTATSFNHTTQEITQLTDDTNHLTTQKKEWIKTNETTTNQTETGHGDLKNEKKKKRITP